MEALVLRGTFIAGGAALLSEFSWVFYVFGALIVLGRRPHAPGRYRAGAGAEPGRTRLALRAAYDR